MGDGIANRTFSRLVCAVKRTILLFCNSFSKHQMVVSDPLHTIFFFFLGYMQHVLFVYPAPSPPSRDPGFELVFKLRGNI